MNDITETPIYDHTRLDLGIDPKDLQGHDVRVAHIVRKYPSKLVKPEPERPKKRGRRG